MGLKSQSIKGFVWATVEKFGNRVLTLSIFFLLAKLLDPESFGVVAIVNSIIAFVVIFVDQGFTTAVVQKDKLDKVYLNTAFWGNMGISVLFGSILFFVSPLIAQLYNDPELILYIKVISCSFIIGALSRVQNALFIREMKFKLLAVRRLIGTLIGGIVGVSMAFLGYGVWSLICYQLTMMTTMTIVLMIQSQWSPRFQFSWSHYIELMKFGVNVLGNNLLFYARNHLVNLMIGYFMGTTALGYYSIANKVFVTFRDIIINTFSKINLPVFSKIQDNKEKQSQVFHEMLSKVMFFIAPASIALAMLSADFIHNFFGTQWIESIAIMQVLLFACAFAIIPSFSNDLLLGTGRPGASFRFNLINAIIYLSTVMLGIQFGLVETAMAVAFSLIASVPIAFMFLNKVIKLQWSLLLKIQTRVIIASCLIVGSIILINYFLPDYNYFTMILKAAAVGVCYLVALYVFYEDLFNEIKLYAQRIFQKRDRAITKL